MSNCDHAAQKRPSTPFTSNTVTGWPSHKAKRCCGEVWQDKWLSSRRLWMLCRVLIFKLYTAQYTLGVWIFTGLTIQFDYYYPVSDSMWFYLASQCIMITAHGYVFIKEYNIIYIYRYRYRYRYIDIDIDIDIVFVYAYTYMYMCIHIYELPFYFMCSEKAQTSQKLEPWVYVVLLTIC